MPTNVLQRNQSYPELGYRIDGKGIAYDLQTNQPLSRQEVDRRIAVAEDADPSTDDYAARVRKRGGAAGIYDRNKDYIVPVADVLATTLSGGMIPPGVTSAAIRGLDQEGKRFGSSFDVGDAAKGYATGALANVGANAIGNGVIGGMAEGSVGAGVKQGLATIPGLGGLGTPSSGAMDTVKNVMTGGTGQGNGQSMGAADWLKTLGAVGKGFVDAKTAQQMLDQRKAEFSRTQGQSELKDAAGAQRLINSAPMADKAQALLMARMAPTAFQPRDWTRGPMTDMMGAAPTGGPAEQIASDRRAADAYRAGDGGINLDYLKLLRDRMVKNAGGMGV